MDVLELLDTKTLKLIDKSSSYYFKQTKSFYFDRDYNDEFMHAIFFWNNCNDYCLQKYGHITFWDVSDINKKNIIPKDINEIFLWKNT